MSLVTRCPACGTMFKVVADQLKVSQGWVRCGHCADVFDASLHFQTLQDPLLARPDTPAAAKIAASSAPVSAFESVQSPAPMLPAVPPSPQSVEPLLAVQSPEPPEPPELPHASAAAISAAIDIPSFESVQAAHATPVTEPPEALPDHEVSFVRDSRRQAFWRKPVVRFALGLMALLLATVLLMQFSVQQRDRLAAMEPRLQPWLDRLCEPLQCVTVPWRHIEAVVIDSSTFNKINNDSYRLSFTLKNTASIPVAMPSLEVSLTDTQEQAVIRRVVSPTQFGVADSRGVLSAGAEFSGAVVIQVLGADVPTAAGLTPSAAASLPSPSLSSRVAGYRVLAFYP